VKLQLIELLILGIPETTLAVLVNLLIFEKDRLSISNKQLIKSFLITNSVMLADIYFSRLYFSKIVPHTIVTTLMYMLILEIIWNLDIWKSIFVGMTSMIFIILTEIISSYPIAVNLIEPSFFNNNLMLMTIPARILQISILFLILRYKFTLSNNVLFSKKWKEMSLHNKITIVWLNVLVFIVIMFCSFYADQLYNLTMLNLQIYFFAIGFVLVALLTINRTGGYESLKNLIKDDIKIFIRLLSTAPLEKLKVYKEFLDERIKELENKENKR
jgi:hypothetical protein